MLNFLRKSLSVEIENFVSYLRKDCSVPIKSFTKSAFVQCRKKIRAEVFEHLSSVLINELYTDNEAGVKLWNGFRLLGVDGSSLTLPDTKELREKFGETKNQTTTSVVQARTSILYDLLNFYTIHGVLSHLSIGEITLAYQHLNHCKLNDLVIYDRGYPSFSLIYEHNKMKIDFLMRTKQDFNNETKAFFESGKTSQIVEISPSQRKNSLKDKEYDKNTSIKVRLVRIELSSGETEILMTSLLKQKEYSNKIFKELYYKRWGIEIFYDELKNKLKTECFSGYSYQCIMQDFYATLFISNIQTLIVSDLNDEIAEESKHLKYKYKVNTNVAYGFLKNRIIALIYSETSTEKMLNELYDLYRKNLIPIRPNRNFKRNKDKYRRRMKPKIVKNQKDAI